MAEPRSRRHHAVKLALTSLVAAPALTVLATAPAFAGQSDQGAASSQSDHSQGNAGTSGTYSRAQPNSTADDNPGGANGQCGDGTYCSTRADGTMSGNGNQEQRQHTGEPCAGCVGKADNKNPPGQETSDPMGTFPNNGYECDHNNGIGQTNPAHTGCTTTSSSTTEVGGSDQGGQATTGCSDEPSGTESAQDSDCGEGAVESGDESGEESGEHQADTSDQQGRTIAEMPAMQPAARPEVAPEQPAVQPAVIAAVAQPETQPEAQPENQPQAQPAPATGTQQVPAVVLGESLTASGSTGAAATAATAPGTSVMGEQLSRTATGGTGAAAGAPQLPFTGSPAAPLGLLGAGLVAFGGGLLLVARRRVTQ